MVSCSQRMLFVCFCFTGLFFPFYSCSCSIVKFPGQRSNQSCSCQPKLQPQQHQTQVASVIYATTCGNTGSLTHCTTWELPFDYFHYFFHQIDPCLTFSTFFFPSLSGTSIIQILECLRSYNFIFLQQFSLDLQTGSFSSSLKLSSVISTFLYLRKSYNEHLMIFQL